MLNETETQELINKIDGALEPVMSQSGLAKQDEFKFKGYVLPGLAYNPDGSITVASLMDLIMVCLAVMGNTNVDEVLKANSVCLKDKEGKLLFPRFGDNQG